MAAWLKKVQRMSESKQPKIKQKGYILVGMLFMMVLIAVSAISLNRKAGMQERMAANHMRTAKLSLGQMAAIEQAAWQLKKTPDWRTDPAGEEYFFSGVTYNRKVLDSGVTDYMDAITITVNAPAGLKALSTSFRATLEENRYWLIADTDNHCIRRIDSVDMVITTIAGQGNQSGYVDDDILATSARLYKPHGVCTDSAGNIYIADTENSVIRMVEVGTEIIRRVAGVRGSEGYSSGDEGQDADTVTLFKPFDVFMDTTGDLYIADTMNNCIRRVDAVTKKIYTVAGQCGQSGSSGDGGLATNALLNAPEAVHVDESGNITIADTQNHTIRKVDTGGDINTVAGQTGDSGKSTDGQLAVNGKLDKPTGVYVDEAGNIFIADMMNHCIRKVDTDGKIWRVAGRDDEGGYYSGDGVLATNAVMNEPNDAVVDSSGNIYIPDTKNYVIRKVESSDDTINNWAGTAQSSGYEDNPDLLQSKFNSPKGIVLTDEADSTTLEKLSELYWRLD